MAREIGQIDGLWKSTVIAANYTVPQGRRLHLELGPIKADAPGRPAKYDAAAV